MHRALILGLFAALITLVLAAAPVPKDEAGRIARVYGTTHDPDTGAEFRNAGDTLIITTPLETRLLAPFWKLTNAPRAWREVRGSFTVTVRVSFHIRPAIPAKHEPAYVSRAGGGLVIWHTEESYLTLTRDERENDDKPAESYRSEYCHKDVIRGSADYTELHRSGHLRVMRREKGLDCSYSFDGKKWTPVGSYAIAWGDTLKVGVVAENGYKAPFAAAFDDYSLTLTKE